MQIVKQTQIKHHDDDDENAQCCLILLLCQNVSPMDMQYDFVMNWHVSSGRAIYFYWTIFTIFLFYDV